MNINYRSPTAVNSQWRIIICGSAKSQLAFNTIDLTDSSSGERGREVMTSVLMCKPDAKLMASSVPGRCCCFRCSESSRIGRSGGAPWCWCYTGWPAEILSSSGKRCLFLCGPDRDTGKPPVGPGSKTDI